MLHFCIDFQTFHTRQNWFHSLTFPHFMSIHVTFPHFSQKHFSSILGSPFLLWSFMPPPPQFDQLQKQGNMVYRMQEIHMTILEKYQNISRQFSVSATYVACCLPPWAATAVASSASCQQLLPKSHKSQPHMCPNTQIYTPTNTNTFQHTNTRHKNHRNTNEF